MGVVIVEGEGAVFGVNFGASDCKNGVFVVYFCRSPYSDRAVV